MKESQIAEICRALSDSNRVRILRMLENGERCACELLEMLSITQPTLSHHMKVLCDCGLVNTRKEGKWSYYSLHCDTFGAFQDFIANLLCCQGERSLSADACCREESSCGN